MSEKLFPLSVLICIIIFSIFNTTAKEKLKEQKEQFQPLSYEQADEMADSVLLLMTLEEKIAYIGGYKDFLIMPIPRLNLDEVYMSDATQGVHIRQSFREIDLSKYQPEKSTAFPCPILLASTWNPDLAYKYAE